MELRSSGGGFFAADCVDDLEDCQTYACPQAEWSGANLMPGWTHHRPARPRRNSLFSDGSSNRPASPEQKARTLRLRLQELGPIHSCFALYLSSRVDVLPAEYCRELALTPDTAPPLAPLEVQRVLEHEIGHAK